jgi:2-(1,2-epoxy-1,2-dihydrophenyl)acetyl-CoA isomerase
MMEPVSTEVDEHGVLLIRMQSESNLNAMSAEMMDGLQNAFARSAEADVRAVVITGAGRAFSAGGDVKAQREGLRTANSTFTRLSGNHARLTKPLLEMDKPVIAAVNGVAAGAGVAMALASDLRVVSNKARFVLAFSALGLVPDFAAAYLLPRLLGLAKAKEVMLLRRELSAADIDLLGLATAVVPSEQVLDKAMAIARQVAQGPTVSLGLGKRLMQTGLDMTLTEFLALEAGYQAIASQTEDHKAAREAFLSKTEPAFTGQ